ncbi:IDEAL domain-containing protein [Virgibacillus halotolerans]|uniref:IDEAL domain-containing protein n=1 Tax=Virgibacillus halotolerans TaxID=1071053 RepID=UPI001EF94EF3|nr:IDEAL domain-containing protein [Virgibacillus halotolerans]
MKVKQLKPYHIKADADHLYVIVSPSYFTLLINREEYQLDPTKAKEIIIKRRDKTIANLNVEFTFRKNSELIYITMGELMKIPDFLIILAKIAAPFFIDDTATDDGLIEDEVVIGELERLNIKRLIDRSLDERDEKTFYHLLTLL